MQITSNAPSRVARMNSSQSAVREVITTRGRGPLRGYRCKNSSNVPSASRDSQKINPICRCSKSSWHSLIVEAQRGSIPIFSRISVRRRRFSRSGEATTISKGDVTVGLQALTCSGINLAEQSSKSCSRFPPCLYEIFAAASRKVHAAKHLLQSTAAFPRCRPMVFHRRPAILAAMQKYRLRPRGGRHSRIQVVKCGSSLLSRARARNRRNKALPPEGLEARSCRGAHSLKAPRHRASYAAIRSPPSVPSAAPSADVLPASAKSWLQIPSSPCSSPGSIPS